MAPPRIRRKLEDQSAAAKANAIRSRVYQMRNADQMGIMNPNLRGPAVGNTAGRRPWTPGSTGRMIYSTPEENEFSGGVLPGPGQYQNPYFGQKQWNPDDIGGQTWDVDYTTEDLTEQERPRWDILNRLKQLYPFNRGGIASLPYAR
jgi:hypothetical protein